MYRKAYFLGHFRRVTVEIVAVVAVDTLAKVRNILIWCTHIIGVGSRHYTVYMIACRSSGKHVYLELATGFMLTYSFCCKSLANKFRCAGAVKPDRPIVAPLGIISAAS